MKQILKQVVLMIQFYTRIPIPVSLHVTEGDFAKGVAYAPVAGALIGLICTLCFWAAFRIGNVFFAAAIYFAVYAMITGCLHIDGLGDTFDGLFSNQSKERMLEIMRDSRIGINGLAAVLFLILINIGAVTSIEDQALYQVLFCLPVIGRFGSLCSCFFGKYAREGSGTGRAFFDGCGWPQLVIGAVITLLLCGYFLGLWVLFYLGTVVLMNAAFCQWITEKIGGMTGDTSGAACELSQTLFLVLVLLIG